MSAVSAGMTASVATSVNRAIFSRISSRTGWSRAQDDDVGLDADAAQLLDRVLGRLRLELAGGGERGQQRHVDVQDVGPPDVLAHLADGLEERQALDVADGPADLDDHDVRVAVAGDAPDPLLDLVGDVRDDLDRAAEVVAAALLGDDRLVDAAGRDVAELGQVLVDEPLVVAEVEVRLGAVVGDEDLAVLVRAHRARIHVDIRIELQDGDPQAARLEQAADAGGGDAFAERGGHASGHKDILRHGSGPPGVFPMLSERAPALEIRDGPRGRGRVLGVVPPPRSCHRHVRDTIRMTVVICKIERPKRGQDRLGGSERG